MDTLTNLNTLVQGLANNAHTIGLTAAGLFVSVYSIAIMMGSDNSPAGRSERWAQLRKVFICAMIIAGTGVFIRTAEGFAGKL